MKKIITLVLFMFLLSGCTANYELVYENGNFYESLNIVDLKDNVVDGQSFNTLIDNYYNNVTLLVDYKVQPGDMSEEEINREYETYKKTIINDGNNYGLNLKYDYDSSNKYINSAIRYSLFENMNIIGENISAGEIKDIFNNYSNLDKITVTFRTDKYVNYNNADIVEDGKYTWIFTKSNYQNKNIKINISDEDTRDFVEVLKDETHDIEDEEYDNIFKYVFIIIGIVLLIIALFVFVKIKNSNKK